MILNWKKLGIYGISIYIYIMHVIYFDCTFSQIRTKGNDLKLRGNSRIKLFWDDWRGGAKTCVKVVGWAPKWCARVIILCTVGKITWNVNYIPSFLKKRKDLLPDASGFAHLEPIEVSPLIRDEPNIRSNTFQNHWQVLKQRHRDRTKWTRTSASKITASHPYNAKNQNFTPIRCKQMMSSFIHLLLL